MLKHLFYATGLGVLLFILYLLQYTGAFKSVTIDRDQRGPYTVIYKKHVGAYHKIVGTIQEVETWSRENGLKCRLSFGVYYDDPRIVEEGRLNSIGGCLVDTELAEDVAAYEKVKAQLPADYETMVLEKTQAVVALFTGAPGIGPLKVYPKAEDYIAEHRLSRRGWVMEIYEVFNANTKKPTVQTTYIWPLQD